MKTAEYEIVDHGFDAEQYFQGCGTAFTSFTEVATGIGETKREAFDDALEQLACGGWEVDGIELTQRRGRPVTVQGYLRSIGISKQDREDTETHYYVSVRVK